MLSPHLGAFKIGQKGVVIYEKSVLVVGDGGLLYCSGATLFKFTIDN